MNYVSEEEIVALYKCTDALVFPSLFGPTNIPITEAIVLGVPVACSNLFAMPEQLNGCGILFDPMSVNDMADKLALLWVDPLLRKRLANNSLNRAANFSIERYSSEWVKVVHTALSRI